MSARTLALAAAVLLPLHAPVHAQSTPGAVGDEILGQFDASAQKLVALARAMPADAYDWRPMEGVASVADVYMHIARYNYYYPDVAMGVEPPPGIDYERWEGHVTEKEAAVAILERSMEHVRQVAAGMSDADWAEGTRLYGRDIPRWSVLLQLVTHMNEHLGQSIAYARSNRVVPPWSR